jgi:hypothetical protein
VSFLRRVWSQHRENAVAIAVIGTLLVTIVGVAIAYFALRDQTTTETKAQAAQRAAEARAQAEQVSAAPIAGAGGLPITDEAGGKSVTRVGLYNRSSIAVYNAVVSLVLVQGAGPRKAVELSEPTLKQEFQRYLTAIPPGEYETQVSPGWAGMFRRPGIELAFTDHAGRNWIRYADGMLVQIKQAPASYYRLEEPVGWLQPEPLKSK